MLSEDDVLGLLSEDALSEDDVRGLLSKESKVSSFDCDWRAVHIA